MPFRPILGLISAVYSIHVTSNNMLYKGLNCIQNWPPQEEKVPSKRSFQDVANFNNYFVYMYLQNCPHPPPPHTQHTYTCANVCMQRENQTTVLNRELTFFNWCIYGTCHNKVSLERSYERPFPFLPYARTRSCQTPVCVVFGRPYHLYARWQSTPVFVKRRISTRRCKSADKHGKMPVYMASVA